MPELPDKLPRDAPPDSAGKIPPDSSSGKPEAAGIEGLSKEEQLALYEQYLKENDWGHQPC
jgi:hypothetical protein